MRLIGSLVFAFAISIPTPAALSDPTPTSELPEPVLLKTLKANGVEKPWYVFQGGYSSGDDSVHGLVEDWFIDVFVEPRQVESNLCLAKWRVIDVERKNDAYVAGKGGSNWQRVVGIGACAKDSVTKFATIEGDLPDSRLRSAIHYSLAVIGDHEPISRVRFESYGLKKILRSVSPQDLGVVSARDDHLDLAFRSQDLSPNVLGIQENLNGEPSAYVYEESPNAGQFDIYREIKTWCKLGDGSPISPECRAYISGIVETLEITDMGRNSPRLCARGASGIDQIIEKIRPSLRRKLMSPCAGLCPLAGRVAESLYETFPCER